MRVRPSFSDLQNHFCIYPVFNLLRKAKYLRQLRVAISTRNCVILFWLLLLLFALYIYSVSTFLELIMTLF